MGNAGDLIVDGIAAWRLTHLIVEDSFPPVAKVRDAVLDRYGPEHPVSDLITCVYCTGVWVAFGVRAARRVSGRWDGVAKALAVAAAAPLVEGVIMRLEAGSR